MPDRILRELLFGKKFVQPHELLVDDPPGADVFVAYFGIAHLSVGQAHIVAAGGNQCVRVPCLQGIVTLFFSEENRVKLVLGGIGIFAPAIADNEQYGWSW